MELNLYFLTKRSAALLQCEP